jgi:hypothetical protein
MPDAGPPEGEFLQDQLYTTRFACYFTLSVFIPAAMATLHAVKKAVTLPPTVRTLASGAPYAPLVNARARAALDDHADHSAHGPRGDRISSWAHSVSSSPAGLVSKSHFTREFEQQQDESSMLTELATVQSALLASPSSVSSPLPPFPATPTTSPTSGTTRPPPERPTAPFPT